MSDVPYLFFILFTKLANVIFCTKRHPVAVNCFFFSSSIVCTGRYHNLCSNPSAMLKPWGLPRNIRIGKTT